VNNLINSIKKVDWQYSINRQEMILFNSITNYCYFSIFKKITGINLHPRACSFNNGDIFYSASDLEKIKKHFSSPIMLDNFSKKLIKEIKKFEKLSQKLEKLNFNHKTKNHSYSSDALKKYNRKKIYRALKMFFNQALIAHSFLIPMVSADKALSEMIIEKLPTNNLEQKNKWLKILVFPSKENEHLSEQASFYKLVRNYKKKSFSKLVKNHLDRYAWIGARSCNFDHYWRENDITKRIEQIKTEFKNSLQPWKTIKQERKKILGQQIILLKKFKNQPAIIKLAKLAQLFSYLRTWRTDVIYHAWFRVHKLFYETMLNANYGISDTRLVTFKELLEIIKTGKRIVPLKIIRKREKGSQMLSLGGKLIILTNTKHLRLIKRSTNINNKIINGQVAFPGFLRGKAKVVITISDLKKINPGDIMVAVMTFPNFIPAMEKASAFITDEGGILCHAAIIAREMKKPAIIATKEATKLINDNDLIEVDANKGVIKILKNNIKD
jgi:phosphohistidine swiveling domain-containing protein